MGLFSKKESQSNGIKKYDITYLGGMIENAKKTYNIELIIDEEKFIIRDKFTAKGMTRSKDPFVDFEIPFTSIKNIEIKERTLSTVEGLMGGMDSRQLNQKNNIHITYLMDGNQEIVLRLEMLTGMTVMGQAQKCNEFMDYLRTQNVFSKFIKESATPASNSASNTNIDELEQLFELTKKGILTQEEFEAKKKQLLGL